MHFLAALALPLAAVAQTFSNKVIYDPPDNYTDPQVLYARALQLADGSLLATWENYSPEPPLVWYPIVKSTDGGESWTEIGQVHDQVNGWGLRYQPFLYQLDQDLGDYEAGTVLLAGNSIPTDLSETRIDVYASRDQGETWEFASHVAAGGEALPNPGLTPVWEPFMMVYNDELVLYYADQRLNESHSQHLSHQTSADLVSWSEPVTDASYEEYFDRPGMPTVAKLPNDEYIYVYEHGLNSSAGRYWFPVTYRISADPLDFDCATPHQVTLGNGTTPDGSPYVVWTPWGGDNGTIVVSSGSGTYRQIFTNQKLGAPNAWQMWDVPQPTGYSRALLVLEEDPDLLLLIGGGKLPPSKTNQVTTSVVRLSEIMKPGRFRRY